MYQAELPLAYAQVRTPASRINYRLPLRWKAVFILLLIYSLVMSALIYGKIAQTRAETGPEQINAAPVLNYIETHEDTTPATAGASQVKMTATVPGWYDIVEIDNENILLKTNMQVWVNGREFTRCETGEQATAYPDLLDF